MFIISVKIILMSATINAEHFRNYFKVPSLQRLSNVPVIKLDPTRKFKIQEYYLDSFNERFDTPENLINYDCPTISPDMYDLAMKTLKYCVKEICKAKSHMDELSSSILVFLPGIFEIEEFERAMSEKIPDDLPVKVLILHSSLAPEDQKKAFIESKVTKVILATNIAESSITIRDVKYVIDFCLTKYLIADSTTNLTSLQTHWTSKNSCMQRTGRVGRVQDGVVYRLVHRKFFEVSLFYLFSKQIFFRYFSFLFFLE